MKKKITGKFGVILANKRFWIVISVLFLIFLYFGFIKDGKVSYARIEKIIKSVTKEMPSVPPLDKADYDLRLKKLANIPPPPVVVPKIDTKTGKPIISKEESHPVVKPSLWPVKTVYPNDGAILPFHRIVAYYGNLYSKKMGVLGEYPEDEMLAKLDAEVKKWTEADPQTPAMPALHYIVVTAQGSPGDDGKYRLRMPESQVNEIIRMADKIHAIVFLDVQVGFSTLQAELPLLEKYLKLPQVHLGIDPEFSMKTGIRPGKIVGTFDAADVNYAANFLAKVVKENNLPPKILIVHRYTQKMVTNYKEIKPLPEVQIVMNMDGWGGKAKKINTYKRFIVPEPVQFTGFKLFYKNDVLEQNTTLFTPKELLKLAPQPIYIQYQ